MAKDFNLKKDLIIEAKKRRQQIPKMVEGEMWAAARRGMMELTIDSNRLFPEQMKVLEDKGFVLTHDAPLVNREGNAIGYGVGTTKISWEEK